MDNGFDDEPADGYDSDYKMRRAPRLAVDCATHMQPQNLYNIEIRVRDVSTLGFMAECKEPVRIGSYVALDVPGIGPVHAQVRWQIGARMGGMFLDPISLVRCEWVGVRAAPASAAA
ncbi:MAG: hypothetical protein KF780_11345 [Sphingomonas sp.]|nr:hypothetical protein [Sphingomonas sp.]